jgi:hypothetical protein
MATRKQRNRRSKATPADALGKASTISEYRALRGLPEHIPISYFPEIYSHAPLFGARKWATLELEKQLLALQTVEEQAQPANTTYTLEAAVCFERYPRITADRTPEELAWGEFEEKIHIEKSALMQVEIEYTKKEAEAADRLARGESDFGEEETKFVPASRETAADAAGDTKSIHRKLQDKLFLLTKGGDEWRMPQVEVAADETLREAAERSLKEVVPDTTDVYFLGNAPSFCETAGTTKVFYYRAVLVSKDSEVQLGSQYSDFKWLALDEINATAPDFYKQAGSEFLY